MNENIKEILEKISNLNKELSAKYAQLAEKYGFHFANKKVVFLEEFRKRNLKFRIPVWKYVFPRNFRHLLSLPFIYMMIVPVVILDIFITIYHTVAFPLYHIPKVKRGDFIVYDRKFLDYLNIIQKVHCIYCTYVNGLFAYAVEIAGRTERYWCPIKSAHKPKFHHGWYSEFADYGSPEEWKEKFNDEKAFAGLCENDKNNKDTQS
ncbi:MAG: hypothetical protein A3J93_00155 [Candidatus Magasanikbacteria bacterium RIFOXYC2_FULL_42_28]|uniref:Uncharacterized protein n=1 Tax=Candidatus Magasanikbacteria bacterium RIFOXYC2_FULL_42_28 TaxID=1798704 RepID=A0A1F6NW19_9BACT|nr:MAG: hypothetical protein A3J93_00155 [Candidatus Magasanikbacteria bacterium RIFOXYC2_FULL_42_28]